MYLVGIEPVNSASLFHTRQLHAGAFATHRHDDGFDDIHRYVLSRSEGHKISRRDGCECMNFFYDKRLFQPVPGAIQHFGYSL